MFINKRAVRMLVRKFAKTALTGKGKNKIKNRFKGKLNMVKGFDELIYKLLLMFNYFIDEQVPLKNKLLVGGALIYFINPFDIVPDIIPFSGFIDDIIAVTYVWNKLSKELLKYADSKRSGVINEDNTIVVNVDYSVEEK